MAIVREGPRGSQVHVGGAAMTRVPCKGMATARKREAEWFVTYERPAGGRGMRRLAAASFEKVVRKFKHVHRGEGLRILDVELTAGR